MRSSSLFCARLLKNCQIIIKNSTLTLRGRVCLSKKCAVFAFGDAMQRSGQPGAFPTALFGLYGATSEGYRPCSQDTIPGNPLPKVDKLITFCARGRSASCGVCQHVLPVELLVDIGEPLSPVELLRHLPGHGLECHHPIP